MKVKVTKLTKDGWEPVEIRTDFIRLDAFLKFAGAAGTGGDAKLLIQEGGAAVNGEVCVQRGKKLRPGDTVTAGGRTLRVIRKAEHAD